MFSLTEMESIAKTKNTIFYKENCLFCRASENLMKELQKLGKITDYTIYYLDKDFDDQTLTDLVKSFGWKAGNYQLYCPKPQVFMSESEIEYIGGNFEFYKSKWNRNEKNEEILRNPMPF